MRSVSVCITTYNRKELLANAIKSIINQTYKDLEIIIVDDSSNDGTKELIQNEILKWDNRITYIRNKTNKGLASSRNIALSNSEGKYFTFMDDDDEWHEEFIEEFVEMAKKYDEQWCFCCGTETIDYLGRKIYSIPNFEDSLKKYIKAGYTPPVSAQFYHTKNLHEVGGYTPEIKTGIDHDLWLKLSYKGKNLKSLNKSLSKPNVDIKRNRITTNYKHRITNLEYTMNIWKPNIIKHYGKEFYTEFCNAYFLREKSKGLKNSLLTGNFKTFISIYRDISDFVSKKEVLKIFILYLMKKIHIKNKTVIHKQFKPSLIINSF